MLDDFREWLSDNLRYILLGLGALLLVLIIVFIIRLAAGAGKKSSGQSTQTSQTSQSQTTQTAADSKAEDSDNEEATEDSDDAATVSAGDAALGTSDLVRDDAAILTLVQQYYTAVSEQDTRTLSSIVTPWDDEVQEQILSLDMIEAYDDIKTYSKKGLKDGEYVVFVRSDVKIYDIDTLVPTLDMLYLITGDGGALMVASNMTTDEDISAYVTQVSSDTDVQALLTDVSNSYAEALASDEALSSYMSSAGTTDSSIAAADTSTDSGDDEDDSAGTTSTSTVSSSAGVTVGAVMSTTTTINIRQTASTSAAIMGVLPEGTSITVLSDNGDGWVQISYDTSAGEIVGYVMSDYLTTAGSAALADDDTAA